MKPWLIIVFLFIGADKVFAEQTPAQHVNDIISYGTVFTNIGMDTISSFRNSNKKCALTSEAIKIGSTILISETLKHFINEDRPDHSDNKSFPSEHTALAMTTSGWSVGFGLTLGIATGIERVTANRHHWYDVLAGGGIGLSIDLATTKFMHCPEN